MHNLEMRCSGLKLGARQRYSHDSPSICIVCCVELAQLSSSSYKAMDRFWSGQRRGIWILSICQHCWWALKGSWGRQMSRLNRTLGVLPVERAMYMLFTYVSSCSKMSQSHWCSTTWLRISEIKILLFLPAWHSSGVVGQGWERL